MNTDIYFGIILSIMKKKKSTTVMCHNGFQSRSDIQTNDSGLFLGCLKIDWVSECEFFVFQFRMPVGH